VGSSNLLQPGDSMKIMGYSQPAKYMSMANG